MAVESIAVVLHHSRTKGTGRLVMVGIANHDGDGGAWPSLATLARYAGVSISRVQQCIRQAVELGELVVHHQQGGSPSTPDYLRPNRYEIRVRCPIECDRSRSHRMPGDPGYADPFPAPVDKPGVARSTGWSPRDRAGRARSTPPVEPAPQEGSLEPTHELSGHLPAEPQTARSPSTTGRRTEVVCREHETRYPVGAECSGCRADRLAAPQ